MNTRIWNINQLSGAGMTGPNRLLDVDRRSGSGGNKTTYFSYLLMWLLGLLTMVPQNQPHLMFSCRLTRHPLVSRTVLIVVCNNKTSVCLSGLLFTLALSQQSPITADHRVLKHACPTPYFLYRLSLKYVHNVLPHIPDMKIKRFTYRMYHKE